jgi:hypothetical protein
MDGHAAIWNGIYHYVATASVKAEQSTYTDLTYGWDIETANIPMGQIQGFGRIWQILILGAFQSAFRVRVRLARNYAATYFQDKYSEAQSGTAGDLLQIEHRPSIQEMEALRIRLTANHATDDATPPTGEAAKLTALALNVGLESQLMRLPAAQRQ